MLIGTPRSLHRNPLLRTWHGPWTGHYSQIRVQVCVLHGFVMWRHCPSPRPQPWCLRSPFTSPAYCWLSGRLWSCFPLPEIVLGTLERRPAFLIWSLFVWFYQKNTSLSTLGNTLSGRLLLTCLISLLSAGDCWAQSHHLSISMMPVSLWQAGESRGTVTLFYSVLFYEVPVGCTLSKLCYIN